MDYEATYTAVPDDERELHAQILEEFDEAFDASYAERQMCLQDRRFCLVPGAQWEGSIGDQFKNAPKIEINKTGQSALRIENEYLNNTITVDFVSRDGVDADDLADVLDGLYRADEADCCASEAYDNAFGECVRGGMGAWRLMARYEDEYDEDDDRQRIAIVPIFDADQSVFFDVAAKRQDKSDARHAFVLHNIPRSQYEAQYGDDVQDWPTKISERGFDWATPDDVCIAEYYRVCEEPDLCVTMRMIDGEIVKLRESEFEKEDSDEPDESDDSQEVDAKQTLAEKIKEMRMMGAVEVKRKKIKKRCVRKWILSGGKILEDCGIIAGDQIPIIPVYGKRAIVDGIERISGNTRDAKDAQRLLNAQVSKIAELSATSSTEKPIFTPEQITGHETMWADDAVERYAYMLVNPITDVTGAQVASPPVGYTKSPNVPPALAALLQITEQDIAELLGNNQQAEKMVSNISGKAVEMIQQRIDMQSYIYMSGMAKAMQRCGAVWLSMAKDLYTEPKRKMKTISAAGKAEQVTLMEPYIEEGSADVSYKNDISKAKHLVVVDVGPSSVSKRAATTRELTALLQVSSDPDTQKILQSLILMNTEGNNLGDVAEYFRKHLVQAGVIKPTEQEREEMMADAQGQNDPNAVFLQAAAEEAMAKATKARADVIETMASAELKRTQAAKTAAEIETSAQESELAIAKGVNEIVGGQLERMQQQPMQFGIPSVPQVG